MSINDLLENVKPFYNLLLILIISIIFFILGRISALEDNHVPIKIEYSNSTQTAGVIYTSSGQTVSNKESGVVIGSKNGKKYYFPWCGTVKMIKSENQIRFASADEAKKAGYTPASNCKGLK